MFIKGGLYEVMDGAFEVRSSADGSFLSKLNPGDKFLFISMWCKDSCGYISGINVLTPEITGLVVLVHFNRMNPKYWGSRVRLLAKPHDEGQ